MALAAGCATTPQTTAFGVVESVRSVRFPDDKPGEDIFAGAAIGGLLGETIGNGFAGALIGTVGGAFAGNEVHRRTIAAQGQEIVVRLDDGSTITVVQSAMRLAPGQRVRVLSGSTGARVEPGV